VDSISDYALISDSQGSALVSRAGSIDWACLPRFDSPAIFSRLLGDDAGHWSIAPVGPAQVERAYLPDTMVLRTLFRTTSGTVAVTDAMAFGADQRGHDVGKRSPHVIVRRLEGLDGEADVEIAFFPRPEYGLTTPVLVADEHGVRSRGGPVTCVLSTEIPLEMRDSGAIGRLRVRAGESQYLALRVASPWASDVAPLSADDIRLMLEGTVEGWRSWSALHQTYEGSYEDLVRHSGRVLQALTYAPSGAVVAAATSSLPETLGGERNWDYRFCWVRDASLTLAALWVAACPDEARDFFDFLATAGAGRIPAASYLQILYGVGGERLVPEQELVHLEGYHDSRPVRVGNGAWDQEQLDVYGELLDAAALLAEQVGTFDDVTARFLVDVADVAAAQWTKPDQGIWELRTGAQHFVHSKLMCWVALDRAVRLAGLLGAEDRVEQWERIRDEIRTAIEQQGWNEQAGAFTQAFGSADLDAANLQLLLTGFLPPDDPRIRATVHATAERLTDERGFVYRYRSHDGLAGEEGTFAICTFWLAQCLAELGEVQRARELFERMAAFANDVGLMSEQVDAASGELLGNFPQAFSHIGLVNAAWAIACAEGKAPTDAGPVGAGDDVKAG
jgi:GH15 family glucan-1,4-alpha-glucosidase